MSRYTDPKCRLCRREGVKLFLKGQRCETVKCPIQRRNSTPGVHVWRRGKASEYGLQLREKQKTKRFYGVFERQFRTLYAKASMRKGNTGEYLLLLLERRLDNVITILGLAQSRSQARQMIAHRHIRLNGKPITRPSVLVRKGDVISVATREKTKKLLEVNLAVFTREIPMWLSRDGEATQGVVLALPTRKDVSIEVNEQLIVELLAK